jgi:hypothetical protein
MFLVSIARPTRKTDNLTAIYEPRYTHQKHILVLISVSIARPARKTDNLTAIYEYSAAGA